MKLSWTLLLLFSGRQEGRFALQVHGGQDVDLWFKHIELKLP